MIWENNLTKGWIGNSGTAFKLHRIFPSGFQPIVAVALTLLTSTASGVALGAYQPPIGIPAPPFGIEEPTYDSGTKCPNWPARVNSKSGGQAYDCYYVDNSVACTDSDNPFGYPQRPRCTIPEGQMTPGAYIDVRGGRSVPYQAGGDRFGWWGTGTANDYILISGARASEKPILTEFVHIGEGGSASYIILEGFEINTTIYGVEVRPGENGYSMDHISVRNIFMNGNGKFKSAQQFFAGASKSLYPDSKVSNIVFYGNESRYAGQWDAATEDDTTSFYVGDQASYIWILDNIAYRSGGDGVGGGHNANLSTHHVFIGRNTLYQHRENGIDIKEIDDLVVSENTIFQHRPVSSAAGEGIVVHYGANGVGPQKSWIMFNKIYECEIGIVVSRGTNTYVIGNLIYDIHHTNSDWNPASAYSSGTAIRIYNVTNAYVVDNTIYDYDIGIQFPNPSAYGSFVAHGNILSNRAEANGYEIIVPSNTAYVSLEHNHVYSSFGSSRFGWGSTTGISLAALQSNYGQCMNCSEGPPGFVMPPTDFSLRPDSTCRNTSIKHRVYTDYQSLYGLNIAKDRKGVSRPQGSAWDIGAYEFFETGGIQPPRGLRVIPRS